MSLQHQPTVVDIKPRTQGKCNESSIFDDQEEINAE
jgi:hypothetical protein